MMGKRRGTAQNATASPTGCAASNRHKNLLFSSLAVLAADSGRGAGGGRLGVPAGQADQPGADHGAAGLPAAGRAGRLGRRGQQVCQQPQLPELYGNSEDVQRGLPEITSEAPMVMQQEWARNDIWVDWAGKEHSGWGQFKYVTGVAVIDLGQSEQGGTRCRGTKGGRRTGFSPRSTPPRVQMRSRQPRARGRRRS
jgi:hypothetical protein